MSFYYIYRIKKNVRHSHTHRSTYTKLTPLEALHSVWLLCSHLKENEEKANDEDGGHLPNRGLKSIALFAGPFSGYTYTALYTRMRAAARDFARGGVAVRL